MADKTSLVEKMANKTSLVEEMTNKTSLVEEIILLLTEKSILGPVLVNDM